MYAHNRTSEHSKSNQTEWKEERDCSHIVKDQNLHTRNAYGHGLRKMIKWLELVSTE